MSRSAPAKARLIDEPPPQGRAFVFRPSYRRHAVTERPQHADTTTASSQAAPATETTESGGAPKLQRKGTISRAVTAGNQRDVSMESGMRMEVSGEITDGVDIHAVLTDANTPILPEGTTQRLSEFDRVAIQLKARHGSIDLGDVDLSLRESEFARLNRKLQGVSSSARLPGMEGGVFAGGTATVAAAATRGQFRLQEVRPLDGVQGPYRLEGGAGEPFILVIAGSEVVYVDGQRLERGEENDYIIDYQTAEITFTPRRLITDDRRIVVEFQYRTFEYTRTLLAASAGTGWWQRPDGAARLRFGATYLREADSREFNAELGLTAADSALVAGAGDGMAFRSGAEALAGPFDPESPFVQYVKDVRRSSGSVDTIYVPLSSTPAPGTQVYRVRFTRLGDGKGSYRRTPGSANGLAYEFVGKGMGEYEPIRVLPRPAEHRLLDLTASFEPFKGVEMFGEWAGSMLDLNRLSALDARDDPGKAYTAGLKVQEIAVPGLGRLSGVVSMRSTGATFHSFDRTRPVEFARHWNIARPAGAGSVLEATGGDEAREAAFSLAVSPTSTFSAQWGTIGLGAFFQGERAQASFSTAEPGRPAVRYRIDRVQSRDTEVREQGEWLRQSGSVSHTLARLGVTPRFEFDHERRRQFALDTDTLARSSSGFLALRPGFGWTAGKVESGGSVEIRYEDAPMEGVLADAGTEITVQSDVKYAGDQTFSSQASVGVRSRRFKEYFRIHQQLQDSESLVLMWSGRAAPLSRALEANWHYEALTERTPVMQEMYLRSRPELGAYVWEDANRDGIVQLDEFLPERTPHEGTYVRTLFPSDSLASVVGVQVKLRVNLEPARLWKNPPGGWQKALAQVSIRSAVEVAEKSRDPQTARIYMLYLTRYLNPTHTMNGRFRISEELSLFRGNPAYGLDLAFNLARGLTELASGEEARLIRTWSAEGRWSFLPGVVARIRTALERSRMESQQFGSRRYDIQSITAHPDVTFGTPRTVQVTAGLAFARKYDEIGDRSVRLFRAPVEIRYAGLKRFQLFSRGEFARVSLDADATGMALYELTEGRGPGTSMLWNVEGRYALNSYLRATLSYDGRAPSGVPALHMFRMQLSASF